MVVLKKLLVCTVGAGSGIEESILFSVKKNNPTNLVLVFTDKSESKMKLILELLKNHTLDIECVNVDATAIDAIFETLNLKLKDKVKLFERDNIVLDFTTGTKAMTSGLSLAGVINGIFSFCYVDGPRDDHNRVMKSTRMIPIDLLEFVFEQELDKARRYFDMHQYDAVLSVIGDMKSKFPHILKNSKKIGRLEHAARGYLEWDRFNHEAAKASLDACRQEGIQYRLNAQIDFLNVLTETNERDVVCPTKELIVDLLENAKRRMAEHRYDDALARLYRLTETIVQYLLWEEKHILTGDVDRAIIQNISNEGLKNRILNCNDPKSKLKLPLRLSFELFCELSPSHNVSKWLLRNFDSKTSNLVRLFNLTQERNNSILAHGFKPINSSAPQKLLDFLETGVLPILFGKTEISNIVTFFTSEQLFNGLD